MARDRATLLALQAVRSSAATRLLLLAFACTAAACDPRSLRLVGRPDGGVYRPDAGCTMVEDSPACPAEGDPVPQLRFESTANPGLVPDTRPGNVSNARVSCVRSYCGTGSFAAHADLEWTPDRDYP